MLITALLPLLGHYSLGFDLVAGPDGTVTLTIIPRAVEGKTPGLEKNETRPVSITASAAEIDAELAKGSEGALGQLITSRRTLAEQISEQREAAEAARTASAEAGRAKAASAVPKPSASPGLPSMPVRGTLPADAKPEEPASLW